MSFFTTWNVRNGWVRERERESKAAEMYTQGWDTNLQWTTSSSFCFRETDTGPPQNIELVFPRLFTFASLAQDHLEITNDLRFYSILYFRMSAHLSFSSLVCFRESGTAQAFLNLLTLGIMEKGQRPERRNV